MTEKNATLAAIYTLSCPGGVVRYVGKAVDPDKRLRQHLCSRANLPVARWVRKLRRNGHRPTMHVLEWTADWEQAERRWIAEYRARGDLLNLADGGTGVPGATAEWSIRNTIEWAEDRLSRVKPFAAWMRECKRTGCEQLLYWAIVRAFEAIRNDPKLAATEFAATGARS